MNNLKNIVDEKPELHLDEIADELVNIIGMFLPFTTIWIILHDKCEYSFQVCYDLFQKRD